MVFACQKDSFLKQFESVVVSCKESALSNGKNVKGYDVILEDTILFPEGGGQPCDFGFIDDVRVENVRRISDKAVHYLENPVEEGKSVSVKIDWDRRFDHMQQHSGQHLITAVADKEFGYPTTSWSLGQETSFIELDTVEVKQDELCHIEEIVNDLIRKCTPVTVTEYGEKNPLPNGVRTRGLPEDHKGDIRVVTIEGLENNMCCGTHVSNLSQLQMIKLVKVEKGKKGKVNLEFLVGGRVIKQLNEMYQREHALSELLKNPPSVHYELVEKLQKSLKVANKNLKSVLRDFAASESKLLLSQSPKPKFHCLHREDGDMDFINRFIKEVNDEDIFLLMMVGDRKGPGQIVLHGKPHIVSLIGPKVCDLFGGKGAGSGKKFQAKVNNFNKKDEAINIVKEYFDSL